MYVLIWPPIFPWYSRFSLFVLLFVLCSHLVFSSCFLLSLSSWNYLAFSYPPWLSVILCFTLTLSFLPPSVPLLRAQRPKTLGVKARDNCNQPLHLGSFSFSTGNQRRGKLTYGSREQPQAHNVTLERCRDLQSFFIILISFSFILSGLSFVFIFCCHFFSFLSSLFLSTLGLAIFVCSLLMFCWLRIWMRKR